VAGGTFVQLQTPNLEALGGRVADDDGVVVSAAASKQGQQGKVQLLSKAHLLSKGGKRRMQARQLAAGEA
jgi:hypothetical protein